MCDIDRTLALLYNKSNNINLDYAVVKREARFMPQVNAMEKMPTPLQKAIAEGKVSIAIENTKIEKATLETELVLNGWRAVENEFKRILYEHKSKEDPDRKHEDESFDEIYKNPIVQEKIDELVNASLEFAEVHNEEEKELLRASIMRVIQWDEEKDDVVFNPPAIKGTSTLLKTSYDDLYNNKEKSKLTNTNEHIAYRQHKREIFGQNVSEKNRQAILKYAYLLKMDSQETETILVKCSFSDKIRWDNQWELAAAYEIECNPAWEAVRASDFKDAIEKRLRMNEDNPKAPENKKYLEFIQKKEQQEYADWTSSYQKHCKENKRDAFLCHWAWLLMAAEKREGKRVVPKIAQAELRRKLPLLYVSLSKLADHSTNKTRTATQEELDLRQRIIDVMKRRDLRLVAAVYSYAQMGYRKQKVDILDQSRKVQFVPPGNAEWLYPSVRGLSRFGEKENEKHCCKMNRSAIIGLGLDLALTGEGISHLLEIGGYYELYARDFYEHSLLQALHEVKGKLVNDSHRFGAGNSNTVSRTAYDVAMAQDELKKACSRYINENLNKLTKNNRMLQWDKAPRWVKECIRLQ